jgi:hypothetical protein
MKSSTSIADAEKIDNVAKLSEELATSHMDGLHDTVAPGGLQKTSDAVEVFPRSCKRSIEALADDSRSEDDTAEPPVKRLKLRTSDERSNDRIADNAAADCGGDGTPAKRPKFAEKLLACPYALYDPVRYSPHNTVELHYRGCASNYLSRIPRLKQHLHRVHKRPNYYCAHCYRVFKSETDKISHEKDVTACSPIPGTQCPFKEKMTGEQTREIKRRRVGIEPTVVWRSIYSTLFPGGPLPSSISLNFTGSSRFSRWQIFARNGSLLEAHINLFACLSRAYGSSQHHTKSAARLTSRWARWWELCSIDQTLPYKLGLQRSR